MRKLDCEEQYSHIKNKKINYIKTYQVKLGFDWFVKLQGI